jgi:hypothetical protein
MQKLDHVVNILNLREIDVAGHGKPWILISLLLLLVGNGAVATHSIGTHS